MQKTTFTFEMPISVKNSLIAISAKRKQAQEQRASIKEILLEMIEKGLQAENLGSVPVERKDEIQTIKSPL